MVNGFLLMIIKPNPRAICRSHVSHVCDKFSLQSDLIYYKLYKYGTMLIWNRKKYLVCVCGLCYCYEKGKSYASFLSNVSSILFIHIVFRLFFSPTRLLWKPSFLIRQTTEISYKKLMSLWKFWPQQINLASYQTGIRTNKKKKEKKKEVSEL